VHKCFFFLDEYFWQIFAFHSSNRIKRRIFIDYQNIKSSFILIVVTRIGRVSTSSSIQVEGSDLGMEQTNEYEGLSIFGMPV